MPTVTEDNLATEEWGDGLAAAKKDVCVWVGDNSALLLPLAAGPVGLPVFPLGVFEGKIDRPGFFDLSIWIIPEKDKYTDFTFDPRLVYVTFEDGHKSQPGSIQVSRFKTSMQDDLSFFKLDNKKVERIYSPEHLRTKSIEDFKAPVELWNWSRFILRFDKPSGNSAPTKVVINGLRTKTGEERTFSFSLHEVDKHRYLVSGQDATGEWMIDTPANPCGEIFAKTYK